MATKQPVRSLSIGPTSDLVVMAKWRPGLIQADEPIMPRGRLTRTFQAIFAIRQSAREAITTAAFADPIERLEQIHSFRLAAEDDGMRLAVTFDFGWESYMRALWRDAGAFLDLLCCHCADYKLARDTPLHEWREWIQENQRASSYFYSATALTVGDLAALSQAECAAREQPDGAAADRLLAGFCSRSATEISKENRARAPQEAVEQAIRVIVTMYRLARYWTADVEHPKLGEDAKTLILATRGMIENFFIDPGSLPATVEAAYSSELSWYRQTIASKRHMPHTEAHDPANIQRGIVKGFDRKGADITHGAALFFGVTRPKNARASLAALMPTAETAIPGDGIFRNLAFTYRGLARIEIAPGQLAQAPAAFREGAAARAASVGDLRGFHPSKWQPLRRNWGTDAEATIALDQIDMLVQLRVSAPGASIDVRNPGHPLHAEIVRLAGICGFELLAVEGLTPAVPGGQIDHLGFHDGVSQPRLDGPVTEPWSDVVEPGALLVGRGEEPRDELWRDGSFLAVRRMPIDRAAFDALIATDASPSLRDPRLLAAKLVGRRANGRPLAACYGDNNFVYDGDDGGAICPLDSHARRANPRRGDPPRIMRRGMSFGPPRGDPDNSERGALFMAYCADLAEQYERVLGWINGGNSTRTGSYLSDPLCGAPPGPEGRTYRFQHAGIVHRIKLPDPRRGVTGLSWSLYLFAPSLSAIATIGEMDEIRASGKTPASPLPDPVVERGVALILKLQGASADAWRKALAEPDAREQGDAAAIWAAIRARHGGVLHTPVGYLVPSYPLIMDILRDPGQRFSNAGAGERMEETIGLFHLGMDPCGADYAREAPPANAALASVTAEVAFDAARAETMRLLTEILDNLAERHAASATVDLLKDLIEPLLGKLAKSWFDVPDETYVKLGPQDWRSAQTRKPRFPGDFWSPSRYTFNPFQSEETRRLAIDQGRAAVAAVTEYIRAAGRTALGGSVSKQIESGNAFPTDADLARVLVGCMIGAVPTVVGNAVRILSELLPRGTFDQLQRKWRAMPHHGHARAVETFQQAMDSIFLRAPMPEMLWRTVAADGVKLGEETLSKGETVIFSLEAASREQVTNHAGDRAIPFGRAQTGPPTAHGCPAHAMADGITFGLVAGMAEAGRFSYLSAAMAEFRPFP